MYSKIKDILKGARVIVVDDEPLLCSLIENALKPYVCDLVITQNARECLKEFEKGASAILADISLPGMSGLDMARQIRAQDTDVPILFLTAFDSDENIDIAFSVGGAGVLKKPFSKRDLIMNLSFILNKFKNDFANVELGRGYSFNSLSGAISSPNGEFVLTKKERALLHLLIKNRSRTVGFGLIQAQVWQGESCTIDAIRSFVYKLRKKLYPELITSAQGSGYQINLNNEHARTQKSISYI